MSPKLWLRGVGVIISLFALIVALTACSGQTQKVGDDDDSADGKGTITIGIAPFDEVIATSNLWKQILEEQGYTVKLQQLELATVYQGLSSGQIDMYMAGVPLTHADYWSQFEGQFVPVGKWYDTVVQGLVVPTYTGLKSISDLEGRAAEFNGQIVGIEAGSGLMRSTMQDLPQKYDMSGFTTVEGSTPAMLAALDKAVNSNKPIVVTLWDPHWAFSRYDLTVLEDDKGAYPANDAISVIVSNKFSENSAVIEQLERFHMTPAELQSLELLITDSGQGEEAEAVREWSDQHKDLINQWTEGAAS